jgi:hypothetical protein
MQHAIPKYCWKFISMSTPTPAILNCSFIRKPERYSNKHYVLREFQGPLNNQWWIITFKIWRWSRKLFFRKRTKGQTECLVSSPDHQHHLYKHTHTHTHTQTAHTGRVVLSFQPNIRNRGWWLSKSKMLFIHLPNECRKLSLIRAPGPPTLIMSTI